MTGLNFHAPYLTEEFKSEDLYIELVEYLGMNCVCKIARKSGRIVVLHVSHYFRLLQIPVQEFLIYQLLFLMDDENKDAEAYRNADEKAADIIQDKYGNAHNAAIVYTLSVFTPLMEFKDHRISNIMVFYENRMGVVKNNFINRVSVKINQHERKDT